MSVRLVTTLVSALVIAPLAVRADQVGFEHRTIGGGIEIGVWYPATGTPQHLRLGLSMQDVVPSAQPLPGIRPLVVISHGTGGSLASHADTAVALAGAGFVVASLSHPGDNSRDNSQATVIDARPRALSGLVTYMVSEWPGRIGIDPARIGAFGFSSGGFTVLASAGGRPDLGRVTGHCLANPEFFDCKLLKAQPRPAGGRFPVMRDDRFKAIVVAAPALGYAFDKIGLADIGIPVQLWRADKDEILPAPHYADAVRDALPKAPEFHAVPDAGHFDFLSPCTAQPSIPALCISNPGFDREAFHREFNARLIHFFRRELAVGGG